MSIYGFSNGTIVRNIAYPEMNGRATNIDFLSKSVPRTSGVGRVSMQTPGSNYALNAALAKAKTYNQTGQINNIQNQNYSYNDYV